MQVVEPIPINLLTGFLGSGKTTLLNHMLRSPAFSDCAVLINEFGDVGVDHHLIESVRGDVVLMASGCVCCTVRGDLSEAIRALYEKREAGVVPAFRRLVIETTGIADPIPVLATIMHDRVIQHHFRIGNVITTVDAVNAEHQLETYAEAFRQIAVADRIVITKADLAQEGPLQELHAMLQRINPTAAVCESYRGETAADALLGQDRFDPGGRDLEVTRGLETAPLGPFRTLARAGASVHTTRLNTFVLEIDRQINWIVFGVWLTLLLQAHGERVLRVKGLLDVQGSETPVVVHGVQHLVHPPFHLTAWPTPDRRSRLVFITRELEAAPIRRSLEIFLATLAPRLQPRA
jgi:G3E family GTPase